MWVLINFVLNLKVNNYWLNEIYEYFSVSYFLDTTFDKFLFSVILSCSILYMSNRIKGSYKNYFSIKENQLEFEIRSSMQTIWFYEVTIYLYLCLILVILQLINNFYLENTYFFLIIC